MKMPKIRFKGFEEEWNTAKIKEIAKFSKGNGYSKADLTLQGTPIILYGHMYTQYRSVITSVNHYVKIKPNSVLSDGNEVIIPSSGETPEDISIASAICKSNIIIGGDLNILRFNDEILNKSFAAISISYSRTHKELSRYAQGKTIVHLRNNDIAKGHITYPSLNEQRLIVLFIETIETQIQATSKKLASLKQIKVASLQSMFPQEGETVPKVRFKGFEGEWEKEKLSKLLVERHEISTITDKLPQLSFTISEGIIYPNDRKSNKRDFLIKDIANKKYLTTYVGDIIYNPANVIYGAIHRNSLCNGVVSPIYKIFSTEQDSNFMECIVRNPTFISQLSMKTEGTVTKLKTLKPESFLEMIVKIAPSINEQQKIASYFCNLDKQISLQTQRLEKLKQIKATCLDKMFV